MKEGVSIGLLITALVGVTAWSWGYRGSWAAEIVPAQHDLMASIYQSLEPTAALSQELLAKQGYLSIADIHNLNGTLEAAVKR